MMGLEALIGGIVVVGLAVLTVRALDAASDHSKAIGWGLAVILIGVWAAGAYYR
jgi:hypothetical protein